MLSSVMSALHGVIEKSQERHADPDSRAARFVIVADVENVIGRRDRPQPSVTVNHAFSVKDGAREYASGARRAAIRL